MQPLYTAAVSSFEPILSPSSRWNRRSAEPARSSGDPFAPAVCRLRDGTAVCLRPLQFGDAPLVRDFLRGLPADSTLPPARLRPSLVLVAVRYGARSGEERVIGVGILT